MQLIDADVLSDKVNESKHNNPHSKGMVRVNHRNEHDHFLRMIYDATTIDAVPVVRCGRCERRNKSADLTDTVFCLWLNMSMQKTDFCSYGE